MMSDVNSEPKKWLRVAGSLALLFSWAALRTLPAQTDAKSAGTTKSNPGQFLKIYVLDGQDATNSISDRKVTVPVVEVRDENDLPIEGAEVTFELPKDGPGGSFPDGQRVRTVRTNLQGQANAPFFLSTQPGKFEMKVTAKRGDRSGETTVSQTNSLMPFHETSAKRHPWYKNRKFWVLAGAGATAAIITIVLTSGGSSSNPTITIGPGSPTISGPH
jgi:hypothetical protein